MESQSQPFSQDNSTQKSGVYKDNFYSQVKGSALNEAQDFSFLEFHTQGEESNADYEFHDFTQLDSQNASLGSQQSSTGKIITRKK